MSIALSPPPLQKFFDNNGEPLAGGLLFTYASRTTTKLATYDANGAQNTNPVVLNARGEADVKLDNTLSYNWTLAPANDTDPPTNPIWSRDDIGAPLTAATLYPITPAETAAGVTTVANYRYPACHVDRYLINTFPGTTDMTAAYQTAISAARAAGGGGNVYWGETITYLVNSTLVLASFTLNPVNLNCSAPAWFGAPSTTPRITSTIAGALLDCSGLSSVQLSSAPLIYGGIMENLSADPAACVIKSDCSGGLRVQNCYLRAANYAVYAGALGFCISPLFYNVNISRDSGLMVGGYRGDFWNGGWIGGRVFAAQYALDVSGTTLGFNDVDFEFCEVICRHQAMSSLVFENCHFETSQVLLTNATTVPINVGGNYTDNGSAGIGISGTVKFIGGTCAFNNTHSNLVVIKTQASFSYRLVFDSMAISAANNLVGNSFTPATAVALPSGTKVAVDEAITLTIVEPPVDSFSSVTYKNASGPGFATSRLTVGTAVGTGITACLNGTATFVAATTVAVNFGVTLPSAIYRVQLTPKADPVGRLWYASPTTTGFTLTNSSSTSISVDWVVIQ